MKGYAKMKENNPFNFQRSTSKKDNPFLDQGYSSNSLSVSHPKKSQENDSTKPKYINKTDDEEDDDLGKVGGVLRRNLSVSSAGGGKTTWLSLGYQKNGKSSSSNNLERQSSTRVVVQEAVKRAFSMRRCSSVNTNSESRYCRIYDQPNNLDDSDYANHSQKKNQDDYDYDYNNKSGSSSRSNSGKRHVGSKVVKACKRLFSR